ncbi:MAG: CopG family transcriptional regulator [Candidatus Bathyarchaeia archaeon]
MKKRRLKKAGGGGEGERTMIVSFHLPVTVCQQLDGLVKRGYFISRSDAIRIAVLMLIRDMERKERTLTYVVGYR